MSIVESFTSIIKSIDIFTYADPDHSFSHVPSRQIFSNCQSDAHSPVPSSHILQAFRSTPSHSISSKSFTYHRIDFFIQMKTMPHSFSLRLLHSSTFQSFPRFASHNSLFHGLPDLTTFLLAFICQPGQSIPRALYKIDKRCRARACCCVAVTHS